MGCFSFEFVFKNLPKSFSIVFFREIVETKREDELFLLKIKDGLFDEYYADMESVLDDDFVDECEDIITEIQKQDFNFDLKLRMFISFFFTCVDLPDDSILTMKIFNDEDIDISDRFISKHFIDKTKFIQYSFLIEDKFMTKEN